MFELISKLKINMKHPKVKEWFHEIVKGKLEDMFKKSKHNVQVLEAAINMYYEKLEKR